MNEINEAQIYKVISIEFNLFIYAFFMEGLGWRYFSTYNPFFDTTPKNSPENFVLKFFVTAIVMYAIAIVQYGLRYLIKFRYPMKVEEIIDLCSLCNISVLMFEHSFHGYYIHGRSPYG